MIFELWFLPSDVTSILPVTYSQLRNWDVTGLVTPDRDRDSRKNHRYYSIRNMLQIAIILIWRQEMRVSVQKIRQWIPPLKAGLDSVETRDLWNKVLLVSGRGDFFLVSKPVYHNLRNFYTLELKVVLSKLLLHHGRAVDEWE